ncbi:MAG: T9SS type A sorting domain-containing protein [Bacteroidia bacterium]
MKRLLLFVFIISGFMCQSQAVISLSPVYSFTPANANTPASSVTFSSSVALKVWIKNKGNNAYSGSIGITAYRDTTSGVFCDSLNVFLPNLQPNDSSATVLTFTPTPGPNAFKSGGNGNTIVVWPFIAPGTTTTIGDSVRPIIYINDPNSIFELDKHSFSIYPNPVTQTIYLRNQSSITNKHIVIYDVFGRKVKETTFKESVDVSELKTGNYWMMIYSDNKTYRIPFVKE